jgi:hypothetical protein
MEDPVCVFGRTDDLPRHETFVCIHIPETEWYMHDLYDGDQSMTRVFPGTMYLFPTRVYSDTGDLHLDDSSIGKGIVLSSMVLERTRLIEVLDRYVEECRLAILKCPVRTRIEAWKAQLVLEKLQWNRSARIVQRQFRECMSNPGYALCKRRLLREFAEGI